VKLSLHVLREITLMMPLIFSQFYFLNCRPGFVRINLPYFMDEETIQFVLEAVKLVAKEGWKLLPQVRDNSAHLT
jgi:hypothetical protein